MITYRWKNTSSASNLRWIQRGWRCPGYRRRPWCCCWPRWGQPAGPTGPGYLYSHNVWCAPIGAGKCTFSPFLENYDKQTDRPTNRRTHRVIFITSILSHFSMRRLVHQSSSRHKYCLAIWHRLRNLLNGQVLRRKLGAQSFIGCSLNIVFFSKILK